MLLCILVFKARHLNRYLSLSIILFVTLWYIVPGVACISVDYLILAPSSSEVGIETEVFIKSYFIESLALCFIILILLKVSQHGGMRNRVPQFNMPSNVFIIALLIALIFVFVVDFFDNRSNYLEANAASGYEGRSGAIYPIARELIISADILFVISQKRWSMLSIIAFVLICLTMLPLVLEGSRILLLMPIIVIAFKYIKNVEVNLSMIFFALAGMIFCIYIIAPIVIVLGKNRQQVTELSILIDPRNLQNAQDALFIELFAKLDSFTQGAVLTNQSTSVSGMGVAGLAPFYGSLFVFVPRFLWPERPVAGSIDGTIYGHPSRVAANILSTASDSMNVGVSPLHISLWEFGEAGFPIFVLSGVLFLFIINAMLNRASFQTRTVGVYLLNIPAFASLLPSPDVMVMRSVLAIFFLAGFSFISKFSIRRGEIPMRHNLPLGPGRRGPGPGNA